MIYNEHMALAKYIANSSPDKHRKVGAVVINPSNNEIVSMGYNSMPFKVDKDDERLEKPLKLYYMVHAEANAIINANRHLRSLIGCDMFVTLFPCHACAGMIVMSGIKKLVCIDKPDLEHKTWGESWKAAVDILKEGNVEVEFINE